MLGRTRGYRRSAAQPVTEPTAVTSQIGRTSSYTRSYDSVNQSNNQSQRPSGRQLSAPNVHNIIPVAPFGAGGDEDGDEKDGREDVTLMDILEGIAPAGAQNDDPNGSNDKYGIHWLDHEYPGNNNELNAAWNEFNIAPVINTGVGIVPPATSEEESDFILKIKPVYGAAYWQAFQNPTELENYYFVLRNNKGSFVRFNLFI